MKLLILAAILFLFPFYAQAGFPEGENGYDLKKIEPKNKVVPVQIQTKYENKLESKQWFWQSA